jgi:hypothetical protein
MPALSVDDINQVNAEFHDIGVEAQQLSEYLKGIESPLPAVNSLEHWRHTHVCGSAVEKIYTGMERIMSNLAKNLDRDPVGKSGDSWHQALLLRMSNPYPAVRDRVVSEGTLALLNNLRAFRHRERNSYATTLDLGIVIERARDAIAAVGHLKDEMQPFLNLPAPEQRQ